MAAIYTKTSDGTWQRKIARGSEPVPLIISRLASGNLWTAAGTFAERFPYALEFKGAISLASGFAGSTALLEGPTMETHLATNVANLFQNCTSLRRVPDYNIRNATTAASMFYGCTALREAPRLLTTSVLKDTSSMFRQCTSLKEVHVFDTSGVTTATTMFTDSVLEVLPAFDFSRLTTPLALPSTIKRVEGANFSGLSSIIMNYPNLEHADIITGPKLTQLSFSQSSKLQFVSISDTSNVTSFGNAFYNCASLTMPPVVNTSKAANLGGMFYGCSGLTQAPSISTDKATSTMQTFMGCSGIMYWDPTPLNMSLVTAATGMFRNCTQTRDVPDITTTAALKAADYMFASCEQLQRVPLFDTSGVTNVEGMFQYCRNLWEIPAYNFSAAVTGVNTMFNNTGSLTRIQATGFRYAVDIRGNQLDADALNEFLGNLGTPASTVASSRVVNITGNPGAETCDRTLATSKGWTVTG